MGLAYVASATLCWISVGCLGRGMDDLYSPLSCGKRECGLTFQIEMLCPPILICPAQAFGGPWVRRLRRPPFGKMRGAVFEAGEASAEPSALLMVIEFCGGESVVDV